MRIFAGTSGYSYKEWKGHFYPDDLPAKGMLEYYGSQLPTVEINNTFYRLPRTEVLESWAAQVPDTFRFAIKASRRITHIKRLKDPVDETTYLLDTLEVLGDRLGVVLFQCPPNMKKDLDRLQSFIELLTPTTRAVFEFRHPSWFEDDVLDLLTERKCSLCIADTDDMPDPKMHPTANFGYLRLRREDYDDDALKRWVETVKAQPWGEAFVFFKHEGAGEGAKMARRVMELV